MPFVAHDNINILGFGETAEEAENHMRRDHSDLEPIVSPATRALVESIANFPYRPSGHGGKLFHEEFPLGADCEGVQGLPEERMALINQADCDGFRYSDVRAEVDQIFKDSGD